MISIKCIKDTTMKIAQALKKEGIKIPNSILLNKVANAHGYKNWSAFINCYELYDPNKEYNDDIYPL